MPLTPIRTIISEIIGGDKFEKTTTESGVVFYSINGLSVIYADFNERVSAACERESAQNAEDSSGSIPDENWVF